MNKGIWLCMLILLSTTLSSGADIGDSTSQPAYAYLGKPRTEAWFNQMYKKFADTIVCVDGKYYDIGAKLVLRKAPSSWDEWIGCDGYMPHGCQIICVDANKVTVKIPSVIRKVQVSAKRWVGGKQGWIGHDEWENRQRGLRSINIGNVDTEKLFPAMRFRARVVDLGLRGHSERFVVHTPLTKKQFAKVIVGKNPIVLLRNYSLVKGPWKYRMPTFQVKSVLIP